jgi:hypothetical protein
LKFVISKRASLFLFDILNDIRQGGNLKHDNEVWLQKNCSGNNTRISRFKQTTFGWNMFPQETIENRIIRTFCQIYAKPTLQASIGSLEPEICVDNIIATKPTKWKICMVIIMWRTLHIKSHSSTIKKNQVIYVQK